MAVWCDRIVTGGILFLILFTPIAFGSVHPWAFSIMEAVIFLLVIVWMGKLLLGVRRQELGVRSSGPFMPPLLRLAPYALPLTLFLALVVVQLLPLPPSLLRFLSPSTYRLYATTFPGWPEQAPYWEWRMANGE